MSKSADLQKNRNNQVLETRESNLQEQKENVLAEQLDFEIECPRCKKMSWNFSQNLITCHTIAVAVIWN